MYFLLYILPSESTRLHSRRKWLYLHRGAKVVPIAYCIKINKDLFVYYIYDSTFVHTWSDFIKQLYEKQSPLRTGQAILGDFSNKYWSHILLCKVFTKARILSYLIWCF